MRLIAKLCFGLLFVAGATLIYNTAVSQNNNDGPRKGTWDEVQKAIDAGLPKTAAEKLGEIATAALNEKAYGEAIRAVAMKALMESNIEGNKAEEKIKRLQTAIDSAPAEMKPIMQAILADWYWHFYQQNRWRFMQRTGANQSSSSEDILTWSLPQILKKIDEEFDKSFAMSDQFKAAKSADYSMILENSDSSATTADSLAYRPTMFDVIAHNALAFYSSGEQASTQMIDAFKVKADSPFFADRLAFVQWKPDTPDKDSLTLRVVELYQDLLRFHENDDDRTALLDTDLLRLAYANAQDTDNKELKTARYKDTLQKFEENYGDNPISARATHALAMIAYQAKDYVEAKKIAERGLAKHEHSVGAAMCYNLIQQITAESSEITADRVWNDPTQKIKIEYRNVAKINFRLVAFDFNAFATSDRYEPLQLDDDQMRQILRQPLVKAWATDLPPTPDYKSKSFETDVPAGIKAGSYFLITSHSGKFELGELDQVSIREIWISKLGLMIRNDHSQPDLEGMVVEAQSGTPVNGATIQQFARDSNNRLIRQSTTTDAEGKFRFAQQGDRFYRSLLLASSQGNSISSENAYSYYGNYTPEVPRKETTFFTDRTLYRPGQSVHYKGISATIDSNTNRYQTYAAGKSIIVVFRDVNGQEIERRTHQTNAFGSFNGTFTAPRDRLTGMMSIMVEGEAVGATSISVEEYKRPKFEVSIAPPEKAAQLNQDVTVKGTAKAYTGVPIDGGKVVYRVMREVDYPNWYFWRFWWHHASQSVAITNGVATTSTDGTFDIAFTAKPDETVDRESEPKFRYVIYADVTDGTGETRSAQYSVTLGYTSLTANMTAESWLTDDKPTTINVFTTSLNGEGRAAKGTIKVCTLKQPEKVIRAEGPRYRPYANYGLMGDDDSSQANEDKPEITSDPLSWPIDRLVSEADFQTDATGKGEVKTTLQGGIYRAMLETQDEGGNKITAILPLTVLDLDANKFPIKIANQLAIEKTALQPGQSLNAIVGSGYADARFYVVLRHRNKTLRGYWTQPGQTQHRIQMQVTEDMRGGFMLATLMVHENRQYLEIRNIDVPWTNKELTLGWERFVSKLEPGQKETWTAVVKGPDAERAASEVVATLYDASLDALKSFQWQDRFRFYRQDYSPFSLSYESNVAQSRVLTRKPIDSLDESLHYPILLNELTSNFMGYGYPATPMMSMSPRGGMAGGMGGMRSQAGRGMMMEAEGAAPTSAAPMAAAENSFMMKAKSDGAALGVGSAVTSGAPSVDLSGVAPRKNLNETAFFFPSLVSGKNGEVRIEFSMPEALTKWKFMAFAHDPQTRSGSLMDTAITSKDIMVQPNAPRFLREGDEIEFTAKVSNKSATQQSGTVQLTLTDARTGKSVDEQFAISNAQQPFEVPAGETRSVAWRLKVPDGIEFLTYKVVGSTGRLSDGEEGYLPVLSRRIMLTESISLPIRGAQTKEFDFKKLAEAGGSDSIKHQSLTVQMVSNPAWYAVMSLPYLMEFPHECNEQTFNRLYANALAQHIAKSDPKIERVFEQWRGTEALDSPLAKNEELKSVALDETPWFRQAQNESQARRSVGVLFDQNKIQSELASAMAKLQQAQRENGMWPWFPGGPDNEYITLYIATGFGRLKHLGVKVDESMAVRTLSALDAWMDKRYRDIPADQRGGNHLSPLVSIYLYGRSFFLQEHVIAPEHQEANKYWQEQAKKHWLALGNRQSQAQLAIGLKRFNDQQTAKAIMASIKERSVSNEEMGMFWRDTELSWWWYHAPIETQAMMIEAFDEVVNDQESVEACKVWLIKQKQTQDWKTTKATADAVYALLLRGAALLASNELVTVELGGKKIEPEKVEAGTGFYEERFVGPEVNVEQSKVKVTKVDPGVAWGSLHWQYFEDIGKVTPHQQNPLTLAKELYVKTHTATGPALTKVAGPIHVGDELVVRIVLKTDRDMEFVHLKDHRGSGTEPVNVLSHYHYQDGLGYYESTKDTASHFFIDYLPKGTYVFEYSTRVQLRGNYQTGLADIQCMYAPEFNSHSESIALQVE